jgi:hypothetical protein
MSIIACLTKSGYKLSIDINMYVSSRLFFFIRDSEHSSCEVLIPDMAKLSVGDYNSPTMIRSKTSFFRNYNGRSNHMRQVRTSLHKKSMPEDNKESTAMSYKPVLAEPAWWQQTSTDVASDQESDID